jgi:hypothetical protein
MKTLEMGVFAGMRCEDKDRIQVVFLLLSHVASDVSVDRGEAFHEVPANRIL